jgi:endonuclease YncB( thermonuclease family)
MSRSALLPTLVSALAVLLAMVTQTLGSNSKVTSTAAPTPQWTTSARCIRVIDGDTIEVEIRRTMRIRLLDCWAPESRTKDADEKRLGLAAKERLRRIEGSEVIVQIPLSGTGDLSQVMTLGRVLGHVWVAGESESVNEQQVREGFAARTKAHP